jgi:hypothetical protein
MLARRRLLAAQCAFEGGWRGCLCDLSLGIGVLRSRWRLWSVDYRGERLCLDDCRCMVRERRGASIAKGLDHCSE